jgi:hypothetical protein
MENGIAVISNESTVKIDNNFFIIFSKEKLSFVCADFFQVARV